MHLRLLKKNSYSDWGASKLGSQFSDIQNKGKTFFTHQVAQAIRNFILWGVNILSRQWSLAGCSS